MPEVASVHTMRALTNLAVGYPTDGFIASRLMADVPVLKQSDDYFIFDAARRASAAKDDARAPGAAANLADFDMTTGTYKCAGHALRRLIPDEERENADPPNQPDIDAVEFLVGSLLVNQEIDCKAKLDAGITGGYTSDPTNEWDDYDNGDPYADINLAINAIEDGCGYTPNVMGMDSKVFRALVNHPDILERVLGGGSNEVPAQVLERAIAALFGLEELAVAKSQNNTAVQGQDASMSRIWGSDVYIGYRAPRAALKVPSLGYRFIWRPFSGGNQGFMVSKSRAAEPSAKSDEIVAEKHYDQKVTCTTAGYRLQNRLT